MPLRESVVWLGVVIPTPLWLPLIHSVDFAQGRVRISNRLQNFSPRENLFSRAAWPGPHTPQTRSPGDPGLLPTWVERPELPLGVDRGFAVDPLPLLTEQRLEQDQVREEVNHDHVDLPVLPDQVGQHLPVPPTVNGQEDHGGAGGQQTQP